MSYSAKRTCPQCGRPLEMDESGNLGFCSHHKQWYALSPEYEGLAAKKNREIEISAKLRQEEKTLNARVEAQQEFARSIRNIVLFICAIVIISVLIGIILLRSGMIYSSASEAYAKGDYSLAMEKYETIPKYRDSVVQVKLCQLLLSIPESEEAMLDAFSSLCQEELSEGVLTEIKNFLESWQENEISPSAVLLMIDCINDNRIDTYSISLEAHRKMLNDSVASKVKEGTSDILISLTSSLSVECYRMLTDGNQQLYLDKSEIAKYLIEFAKDLESVDIIKAIDCYFEAYRLTADIAVVNLISDSIDSYSTGIVRVRQRYRLFTSVSENDAISLSVKTSLEEDIFNMMEGNIGSPTDLIECIVIAKNENLVISKYELDEVFKRAALNLATGKPSDYYFIDCSNDGVEELIYLEADGTLTFRDYSSGHEISYETSLIDGSIAVYGNVVIAQNETGIAVFTYEKGTLFCRYSNNSVFNIKVTQSGITFSKRLPGTTERLGYYYIDLRSTEINVVCTSIDWNKAAYVLPASAEGAVLRWLETVAYDIPNERNLLETGNVVFPTFVRRPNDCTAITVIPYFEAAEDSYLLASYEADDGSSSVLSFVVRKIGDVFRILSVEEASEYNNLLNSIASLNTDVKGKISGKNNSLNYYVIVPDSVRFYVNWSAGDKDQNRNIYSIMFRENGSSDELFSYQLEESTLTQESYPLFLEKGVYEFIIQSLVDEPAPFRFRLNADIVPSIEIEPNGDADFANHLDPDIECFGVLSNSDDKDYYKFTLTEPCMIAVEVNAQADGNSKSRFEVSVLKSVNNRLLHSFSCSGNASRTKSSNLYLDKGEYLIAVSKGSYYYAGSYSLIVTEKKGLLQEIEFNDRKDEATILPVDKTITGSLGTVNDSDWYRFTVPCAMVIRPRLTFTPIENSGKAYTLSIFDDKQELYRFSLSGRVSNFVSDPVVLTEGTFFLKLTGILPNSKDYSLSVSTERIDMGEIESNDSLSSATPLSFGRTMTGCISSEDDIDVYQTTFLSGESHIIRFTPPSGYEPTAVLYYLSIEQNGKTLYRQTVKGNSGEVVLNLEIDEGDYFIRVRPGTNCFETYSLRVEK